MLLRRRTSVVSMLLVLLLVACPTGSARSGTGSPALPAAPFASTSVWNTKVAAAPLYSKSKDVISYLKTAAGSTSSFIQLTGTTSDGGFGEPIYTSSSSDTSYTVGARSGCTKPPSFPKVHIPATALASATDDAQMTVYDNATGATFAFADVTRSPATGKATSFSACYFAVYWLSSNGLSKLVDGTNCTEAKYADIGCLGHRGLAPSVYAVRWSEVAGSAPTGIQHALKIAVHQTSCTHFWPMMGDEDKVCSSPLIEGLRLRLKASVNCSTLYAKQPQEKLICLGLQQYGVFIGDSSDGPAGMKVENCAREKAAGESTCDWSNGDGYGHTLLQQDSLSALGWDDFEVVQQCYPMPLPCAAED